MNQFRFDARLSAITLGLLLAGCGDGQQSDLASKMKALMSGQSASSPAATESDPQQARQSKLSDLLKKAEAGDVLAMVEVGMAYKKGDGLPQDVGKAVEWFEKAAAQGNTDAQYRLGELYYLGEKPDFSKALEWLQLAAEKGNAWAQNLLAVMFYKGEGVSRDLAKAVDLVQKAAAQGFDQAQYHLGHAYRHGEGMPRDDSKAYEWFYKAALQGESRAQNEVGRMYMLGEGVPKDDAKAFEWTQKAAAQGEEDAQFRLGMAYYFGNGVATDNVLAYAWSNLANAKGVERAWNIRMMAENKMTPAEVAEAQHLSSGWKVGVLLARESGSAGGGKQPVSPGSLAKKGTGTAFIVNAAGHAITNHHVVDGCTEVRAEGRDGVVKVVTSDVVNDLAQLQIPGVPSAQATIASDPAKLRQGEDIVVFGFPLNAVLSSGGNLTPGVVSALTGLGNNTNQIQITAPIQPGSSGSPVINKKGEVIGVVAMKLSDSKMAKATGQVGQNVNFAVSGQTLKTFLDTHKVEYRTGGMFSFGGKSTADLADEARKWTLVVECWK
ncbi:MAG: trypsin-like peptidase domain-containing protein [Rhodocyclaceae bacterium]